MNNKAPQYEELDKHMGGVYEIINIKNNKFYIGASKNIKKRWGNHKSCLKNNSHKNYLLQKDWDEYGEYSFEIKIVEIVEDVSNLDNREQYWIDATNCTVEGYNICSIAGKPPNKKDVPFTQETKEKLRLYRLGRKHKPETIELFKKTRLGENNGMYNKRHTEESKNKMRINRGDVSRNNNPFYGLKHTEESKLKISKANKGKRSRTKLTLENVIEIKKALQNKPNELLWEEYYEEIGNIYNVSKFAIRKIKRGERWKDV